jgi:hypothetical protein
MCFLKRVALVVAALCASTGLIAGSGTENAAVIAEVVTPTICLSYATVRLHSVGHSLAGQHNRRRGAVSFATSPMMTKSYAVAFAELRPVSPS